MKAKREHNSALYEAILTLKTSAECIDFFEDLCTIPEIKSISQRLEVAWLLCKKETYKEGNSLWQ